MLKLIVVVHLFLAKMVMCQLFLTTFDAAMAVVTRRENPVSPEKNQNGDRRTSTYKKEP